MILGIVVGLGAMKRDQLDTDREIEWRGKNYAYQKIAVIPFYFGEL